MSPEASATAGASPDPQRSTTRRPFGFPRERRLTRGAELDAVRQTGRRIRTEHLELRVVPAESPRIGIIVPRHKHTAVDRNRLKRRLRELARTRLLPTLASGHVVIRARPDAYTATFAQLTAQIEKGAREAARILGERGP